MFPLGQSPLRVENTIYTLIIVCASQQAAAVLVMDVENNLEPNQERSAGWLGVQARASSGGCAALEFEEPGSVTFARAFETELFAPVPTALMRRIRLFPVPFLSLIY
jgi:hypothetical protein